MTTADDTSDLRAAWNDLAARAQAFEDCPEPERIWEAARGELGPEETRVVVEHLATCPACAEAWRLARELEPPVAAAEAATSTRFGGRWIAIAAAVVLAVGLGWRFLETMTDDGVMRGGPPRVVALVPDGALLPRSEFLLEWAPGPEGSRYDLLVTTPDLEVVASATRLLEPDYRVAEAELDALPEGSELMWRVEMLLPDGRHVASPAFRVRVGGPVE